MVGPDFKAPSCPPATVWATPFTTTLVLLEFLPNFEEGRGGGIPLKSVHFCTVWRRGGGSFGALTKTELLFLGPHTGRPLCKLYIFTKGPKQEICSDFFYVGGGAHWDAL